MKGLNILSIFLFGAEVALCSEHCDPGSLSQAVAICCGSPPNLNKEPLLFSVLSSGRSEVKGAAPGRCTTVTGMVIFPPMPSVCCPGPHGRTCCYASSARSQPTGEWSFLSEESDLWTYVFAAMIIVITMSLLTLLAYCVQAVFERSKRAIKQRQYQEILNNRPLTSLGNFEQLPFHI
ncbi:uncharacterized protein LOC132194469 isoform X1 [Neocloeon triangulifer]|uniref:uncharacterized protein LOC132194469 isoform X1 n=1 Tax=Neocloeon triangulifer TaxID=2078957 RepID=UPI00286F5BF8|nr:uncharacterized protein LOC132194469 isoform X1 [Neocloeon triangulifer]